MQPETKSPEMDYKFESKGENTVSVYVEEKDGTKNEIIQLHVLSEKGYAHFREVTSNIQDSKESRR